VPVVCDAGNNYPFSVRAKTENCKRTRHLLREGVTLNRKRSVWEVSDGIRIDSIELASLQPHSHPFRFKEIRTQTPMAHSSEAIPYPPFAKIPRQA
jgi:hypothetical protein